MYEEEYTTYSYTVLGPSVFRREEEFARKNPFRVLFTIYHRHDHTKAQYKDGHKSAQNSHKN